MRRKINVWTNIDWFTVILYVILVFIGWLTIYSALYNEEHKSVFDLSQRYGKQFLWISAAFLLAILIMVIDSNFFSFFAYGFYVLVIILLIAVLFFGEETQGSKAWLRIGNVKFQPAEFAKVATALTIAKYLSGFNVKLNVLKTYFRVAMLILLPMALVFIHDAGTALVFVAFLLPLYREGLSSAVLLLGVYFIILFILSFLVEKIILTLGAIFIVHLIFLFIQRNIKQTLVSLLIFIGISGLFLGINQLSGFSIDYIYIILGGFIGSSIFYLILSYYHKISKVPLYILFVFASITFTYSIDFAFDSFLQPHQQRRIVQIMGLEDSPQGAGYNVNQSVIAIGSGGFSGKGYLKGTQTKYDFVPEQSTDFIFSTIGEEFGFVGSSILIILFVTLLLRLIFLAERQRSFFSRIYGYGVISVFLFHFIINIGMTIGLAPVIGIPLPFISYGGSSLWAFTVMLFIFIRLDVSRLKVLR
ncbi:MAG: rod shape-determining protein RodA [Bacteroidota bacterium]